MDYLHCNRYTPCAVTSILFRWRRFVMHSPISALYSTSTALQRSAMSIENGKLKYLHSSGVLCI